MPSLDGIKSEAEFIAYVDKFRQDIDLKFSRSPKCLRALFLSITPVPVGNLIRLASEAESRNVSML